MSEEKKQKRQEINNKQRRSWQLDLFTNFLANDEKEKRDLSNAIRSWDQVPRYFPARTLAKYAKENPGKPFSWSWLEKDGTEVGVVVRPAMIEVESGDYDSIFPSTDESLIEEVLKKLLSLQKNAVHDPASEKTWVKFSINTIYKELELRGRSRSKKEIKQSIHVMNKCNVSYYVNGEEAWSSPLLSELLTAGKKDYLEDPDSFHAGVLPSLISKSINKLEYRQFNYERLMSLKRPLSVWIYKKLIHDYTYASILDTHHFKYSMLKRKTGLLQQARENDNRKLVIDSLEELKDSGVLLRYAVEPEVGEKNKVVDVKYIVVASPEFTKEQKAANLRAKKGQGWIGKATDEDIDGLF